MVTESGPKAEKGRVTINEGERTRHFPNLNKIEERVEGGKMGKQLQVRGGRGRIF